MRGYFSMILHAHLPYVRHPEYEEFLEEDWLYEAISETYIPLLNMFENLTRDKIPWSITMTMSGTLANMLNDELLRSRYEVSLNKSLELCRLEVERLKDQEELLNVAKFNLSFFKRAKETFLRYNGDLIKAFKKRACAATPYPPYVGLNQIRFIIFSGLINQNAQIEIIILLKTFLYIQEPVFLF